MRMMALVLDDGVSTSIVQENPYGGALSRCSALGGSAAAASDDGQDWLVPSDRPPGNDAGAAGRPGPGCRARPVAARGSGRQADRDARQGCVAGFGLRAGPFGSGGSSWVQ